MSVIRPEARAALLRWREALGGLAVMALGAYWITGPAGLLGWVGWIVALTGLALLVVGVQRARFRPAGQGPGVVQVDEGQIAYFGPLAGGGIAVSELERLTFDPAGEPPHWVLSATGAAPLRIPVNAEGADALFDAFAALPGLRTQRMLATMRASGDHPVVIWENAPERAPVRRLH